MFNTIIRAIRDEHADIKALDKIVYACEQQAAHIDYDQQIMTEFME